MKRFGMRVAGAVLAAAAVAGLGARASAAEPKAASPAEAVRVLVTAAEKKDIKAFVGILAEKPRKVVSAMIELGDVGKAMKAALAEAKIDLGNDPTGGIDADRIFDDVGKIELIGEPETAGDKSVLKIKVTKKGPDGEPSVKEETFNAVKEGDDWRLFPPKWDDAQAAQIEKLMGKLKKAFTEITEGVKSGKLKTKEDVSAVLVKTITAAGDDN